MVLMSQALYRKYRSKQLSEIVGQKHVTDTLNRALETGRLSHAYLFTGPKGVGKTSIARILAHAINNLPYTDESSHLDIIEIDAASNRRIDEIRDLREKVHIAPTSAKYKVYIIDEVHMLTKEAFNALLKTLEEPPKHVIFILATTEAHKLPETIVSRTQRFTFKAIEEQEAIDHLKDLAKKEKIKIDDEALRLIAAHGNGSFRDSISLLEQVSHSNKPVSKSDVEAMVGLAPESSINELMEAALTSMPVSIIEALEKLRTQGITAGQIAKQLAERIRQRLVSSDKAIDTGQAITALEELLEVPAASNPWARLEIVLFGINYRQLPEKVIQDPTMSDTKKPIIKDQPAYTADTYTEVTVTNTTVGTDSLDKLWPQLLNEVKKHNNTLYSVLRMGKPEMNDDSLSLSFSFSFHTKKIANKETQSKLQSIIKSLTGKNLKIVAKHVKGMNAPQIDIASDEPPAKREMPDDELKVITSIFGGGEVIEA